MDSKKFLGLFIPRASFYLWIILLLVAVIAVLDWHIAIPGFLLLAFLTYYNISSNYKRKAEITSYIENLNFNIDTATKDTLLNFPMPLVVTETDGSIIWYNSSFKKISEQEDVFEKVIKTFVDEIKPDILLDDPSGISKQITLNEMHYQVLCNIARHDRKTNAGIPY
jgi:c-di-AMP phosphodiesterase-like protein